MIREFKVQWSSSCDKAWEHWIHLRTRLLVSSLDMLVQPLVKKHVQFLVYFDAFEGDCTRILAVWNCNFHLGIRAVQLVAKCLGVDIMIIGQ